MSVGQPWDEIYQRLKRRWRGILAPSTIVEGLADRGESESNRPWKPARGQSVVVVAVCGAAAHDRLEGHVVGCRGRVSGIERGADHPYEVLLTLSERVYLYGRFAVGELAPLGRVARPPERGQPRDRSSPTGCRPQMARGLVGRSVGY